MLIDIKWWVLFALLGVFAFMLMTRSVRKPLKWMVFGILYTAIGGLALFLLNTVGQYIQFEIPVNPITAFIAGALGIPGIVYLVLVKFVILT